MIALTSERGGQLRRAMIRSSLDEVGPLDRSSLSTSTTCITRMTAGLLPSSLSLSAGAARHDR